MSDFLTEYTKIVMDLKQIGDNLDRKNKEIEELKEKNSEFASAIKSNIEGRSILIDKYEKEISSLKQQLKDERNKVLDEVGKGVNEIQNNSGYDTINDLYDVKELIQKIRTV